MLPRALPRGQRRAVDALITSDVLLRRKPLKPVFIYALRKIGAEPHETVYVGDGEEDLGAMAAGLLTVMVGREGGHVSFSLPLRRLEVVSHPSLTASGTCGSLGLGRRAKTASGLAKRGGGYSPRCVTSCRRLARCGALAFSLATAVSTSSSGLTPYLVSM